MLENPIGKYIAGTRGIFSGKAIQNVKAELLFLNKIYPFQIVWNCQIPIFRQIIAKLEQVQLILMEKGSFLESRKPWKISKKTNVEQKQQKEEKINDKKTQL